MGRPRLPGSEERRQGRYRYQRALQLWRLYCVRLDFEDGTFVEEFAKSKGVSYAEAIRTLIAWGIEQHKLHNTAGPPSESEARL